jgi:putative flavoprotein involved in K+ transport
VSAHEGHSKGTQAIDVIVIGAGQAGLAMSYCLTEQGQSHVVLEQERIAESWRTRRWDSLRLVGPNRTLELPGYPYAGEDPDGFMGKDEVVAHLEAYAGSFGAPVLEGVRVTALERGPKGTDFLVRTENGTYSATQVVVATGALQRPFIPRLAADLPTHMAQVVPYAYRSPAALPPGAVLVVGSGQAGCQIAEELRRAGRPVYLSVGRSWWAPRRYRGRDISLWLRDIGWFDRTVDGLPPGVRTGLPNPQFTGSGGGRHLNVHTLAAEGVVLLGRLRGIRDGTIVLAPDLAENLAWGDEQAALRLRAIDEHIQERGLDTPPADLPTYLHPVAELPWASPASLDLVQAGITSVVWATGYRPDLGWVRLPIHDAAGYPVQRRGVTRVPGLFILGLDWLHSAKSGLFAGIAEDAACLASAIATRRPEIAGASW